MKPLFTAALALALSSGAAFAQTHYNQQRLGDFTYYNGQMNGQPFSGNSHQLGDFNFSTFNNGGRTTSCTSNRIGDFVYTNCN